MKSAESDAHRRKLEHPRLEALPDTLAGRILGLVHSIDRPVNCFPSHHISTATTTALAVWRQNSRWGIVFGALAALISISTLFVKQHFVIDVVGGLAIAWLTYLVSFPGDRRSRRPRTD